MVAATPDHRGGEALTQRVGEVALLARYPVTSLCGEVLDEVEVGRRGLQAHVVSGGRLRRGDEAVLG